MTLTYNLFEERWIPVRRASGVRDWIAPHQIAEVDDPPVALDARRPDFNGALAQFLIGLLQTAAAPEDESQWRRDFEEPPSPARLQQVLAPFKDSFDLFHATHPFMQEVLPSGGDCTPIGQMLIGSPGANTEKLNADHFQKRGVVTALGLPQAATALMALQMNAPSGGAGHRTSLRGGGPISTVILGATLWQTCWLNVLATGEFDELVPGLPSAPVFPWTAPPRLSKKNETLTPAEVHPLTCYWSTPRRLLFNRPSAGACDIEGGDGPCVSGYNTAPHGANYGDGFLHPLTPYSKPDKAEFPLAVKGKPSGLPYTEWPSLVAPMEGRSPATVVTNALARRRLARLLRHGQHPRLWAFGFDMDNMKARGYHESLTPIHVVPGSDEDPPSAVRKRYEMFGEVLGGWVDASNQVRTVVTRAIGTAMTHRARDTLKFEFWTGVHLDLVRRTEGEFFELAGKLPECLEDAESRGELSRRWHRGLTEAARGLFEQYAPLSSGATERDPERVAHAFHDMQKALHSKKLLAALGITASKKGKAGT